MADISFKSITFPGLANKYKIPEVDNTLEVSGKAADAKKTGDEISAIKADLGAQTGIISLLKDFYIKTSTTPISLTPIASTAGRMCAVVDCVAGDKFVINAYSNSAQARAWCFVDSTNTALSMADEQEITDTEITAPANASKLIINDMNGGMSYKVGNNLASKIGSGLSDAEKAALMALLKSIDYTSDNGQLLYNELYHALYGHAPEPVAPVFTYNSNVDGLLSGKSYVTVYSTQGNTREALSQGILNVYSKKEVGGVSAYTAYSFGVYDDSYGKIKVLAKIHSDYLLAVGGAMRIEIANASHGAQFYIQENANGFIEVRYDTGTTQNNVPTVFSADDYHTFEVIADGDKQSLIIDNIKIVEDADMSTQYVTTIRITVLSGNSTQDITASIKSIGFYDEKDDSDTLVSRSNVIKIKDMRQAFPSVDDDTLLERAITLARGIGKESSILWDDQDIHFSGEVTHLCYGFKGIDFNGVNIYMPSYTNISTAIITIKPDYSYDKYFNSDYFTKYRTSNSELFGKIFTMNSIYEGIASMSLGKRYGLDSQRAIYSCPIIKTSMDGVFETGELYLYPQNGDVLCRNIHEYPPTRFFIKNATIQANTDDNFTGFVECYRSNTLITDFVLKGRNRYDGEYNKGVFHLHNCCDIEFCHISGTNPITRPYNAFYAFTHMSLGFSTIHHVFLGDSISWGCMGGRYMTNCTFENCFLDRWDSHFAQFGHNVIDNCVIGKIAIGLGNGSLTVKNSTFLLKDTNSPIHDVYALFHFASHSPGGYNGDIVIDNCDFMSTLTNNAKYAVLHDCSAVYKIPQDSAITPKSDVKRIINNCRVDNNCAHFIMTGSDYEEDKIFFNGYHYTISNCIIECDSIIKAISAQNAKSATIDNCQFTAQTLEDLTCDLHVSNSKLSSITANTVLPNVTMTGCILTGTQGTSNFTKYAFSGNIASDMASVNKHS